MKEIKVLVVDEDAYYTERLQWYFKEFSDKTDLRIVPGLTEAENVVSDWVPSLIIADSRFRDGNAIELIRRFRDIDVPVIVMTSSLDQGLAVDAMKAGARDYIVKSAAALAAMPKLCRVVLKDLQELRESEDKYNQLFEKGRKIAQKRQQLEEARLKGLLDLTRMVDRPEKELYDFALATSLSLTESRFGYIYHYDENGRQFILHSWSNGVMESCTVVEQNTVYDLDKTGIWGEAVRQRKAIMVNDFHLPNPLKKGYPEGHVPIERFLTVPVFDRDEIVAVVGVANKRAPYDDYDEKMLATFVQGLWHLAELKRARQLGDELQKQLSKNSRQDLVGQLTGEVARDFNNLLTGILGFVTLAKMEAKSGAVNDFLVSIGDLADKASRLTRTLIAFSGGEQENKGQDLAALRGNETILLAEDDQSVRKIIRFAMEEFGYSVIECADGAEAVESFKEQQDEIDLVLLDVVMPRLSGAKAAEEIRAIDPSKPLLFVSGYSSEVISRYASSLITADRLLIKPVNPAEVVGKIREVLDNDQAK